LIERPAIAAFALALALGTSEARVARLRIEGREVLLDGKSFGLAGPYEKLYGRVELALDPEHPTNARVVDLELAPRNAAGDVAVEADFYLIKPVDPARGNGILFYEAGNRGRKRILTVFQRAQPSEDPEREEEIGDGALFRAGFSLLWMGWQWDVPDGRMRMDMPVATRSGAAIDGLARGNFIPGSRTTTASVADRGHRAYPVLERSKSESRMTVRRRPLDEPEIVPRDRWSFAAPTTVTLEGGFEPGLIYDVVYQTEAPRVLGCSLAGTRDIVSFFKYETSDGNPLPGIRYAIGWGVSQTGRFLRHFLYQGFNADERGRKVFDGVIDQMGGAGRGSFNHRFGQASRDALQHFNVHFPVDLFPFADGTETDPETGAVDSLLQAAERTGTVPKIFHILTNSEYFHRGGSLVTTDPTGTRDSILPDATRVYFIAGAPHIVGGFPPAKNPDASFLGQSPMNPLEYDAVIRALFHAMALWVGEGVEPPRSAYPRIGDGTLVMPAEAGWPRSLPLGIPLEPQTPHRLDFGPDWDAGIVAFEPPRVGKPFVVLVPAVDADGNDRAGIRLPDVAVPLATYTGWNYRHPSIGAPDRLSSEIGSYLAFPEARIEERYRSREEYLGKVALAALELVESRYLLAGDVPGILSRAGAHYDWAMEVAP
jgi:hypothetical protein